MGDLIPPSPSYYPIVWALAVFDDGGGPALYAGGYIEQADGQPANCIAKWNGTRWSALGRGMNDGVVLALASFDSGGPQLITGASFGSAIDSRDTVVECTATDSSGAESTCSFPVIVMPPPRARPR